MKPSMVGCGTVGFVVAIMARKESKGTADMALPVRWQMAVHGGFLGCYLVEDEERG